MQQVKVISTVVVIFTIFILAILPYFFFRQEFYKAVRELSISQQDPELYDLLKKVSQYMTLPEGIYPTVINVTDNDWIRKEPVLKEAEPGDKLLYYKTHNLGILVDPRTGKVKRAVRIKLIETGNTSK